MATDNRAPNQSALPEHAIIREQAAHACAKAKGSDDLLLEFGQVLLKHVCDLFAVDLVEDDGSIRRWCTLHLSMTNRDSLTEHRNEHPLSHTASYGYPRVIKTGKSQFIPAVAPRIADRLLSSSDGTADSSITVRSFICAPLIAHGRILGAVSVANTERTTFFNADDLLLVEELCEMLAEHLDPLL
jgi:GAF domain-containing protein